MRAQQREMPVIGSLSVSAKESEAESKFAELWAAWEPKVRKTATAYKIDGAVGAELEDLVQLGQALLLHVLRKYNKDHASEAQFNTYYYTCLKNEYAHLLRRCFPKNHYMVAVFDPATRHREIIMVDTPRGARHHTENELESVLSGLRSQGKTYSVTPCGRVGSKPTQTRFQTLDTVLSTDSVQARVGEEVRTLGEIIAAPEEPLTVEQIIERVSHRIPDEQLRNIAVWLFEGHQMSGPDGIMKRLGLKKHQVERALHRIRMLLAGEFGITLTKEAP